MKQQKHKLTQEVYMFLEKERNIKWYERSKKGKERARRSMSNAASDDSDFPLSSPSSSLTSMCDVPLKLNLALILSRRLLSRLFFQASVQTGSRLCR